MCTIPGPMMLAGQLVTMVAAVMVMMVAETEGAPANTAAAAPMDRLIRQEGVDTQLALIQKLVSVVLRLSQCPLPNGISGNGSTLTTTTTEAPVATTTTTEAPVATTSPSGELPTTGEEDTGHTEDEKDTKYIEKDTEKDTEEEKEEKTEEEKEEDCNYQSLSPSHTMLLENNTNCLVHKTGLDSSEKQLILDLHNTLRAKVAHGQETRGSPGPQPPAANMRELVWNDELAEVAQAWASQCPTGHDRSIDRRICGRPYLVGQNIHYYWGSNPDPDWRRGVMEWYDEVVYVPSSLTQSFRLLDGVKIGHYTQVVWADTSEVGCGVAYYETDRDEILFVESKTYVCNYGKTGNIQDRPLYTQGPATSQCPSGVSQTYPDLCA